LVLSGGPDELIGLIAAAQRGRVARRQLLMAEISSKMIRTRVLNGFLYPLHSGVYAVGHPGAVELGAETAALLAAGEQAMLSHDTAARLWNLRPRIVDRAPIHLSVPVGGCPRRPGICAHRTRTLLPRDLGVRDGLPVTSAARTLVDIAGTLTARERELALDEGLRNRIVTRAQVADVIARAGNRAGSKALKELLHDGRNTTVTRSEAEEALLALVRNAGLPDPEVNAWLIGLMVDFLWRRERIVVEVDGYAFHGSRRRFEDDRARDAKLAAAGYHVIRITWLQMRHEPLAVIARLAQALARAEARAG
jgi:very-short-patch-repair endonuclease